MTVAEPLLSVVIPGFNRPEPLKYSLCSVRRAADQLAEEIEVILVDDGSVPPLPQQLETFDPGMPIVHVRQANQGSIVARMRGLSAARGQYVLFLDSDDLVHPDKFSKQIAAMQSTAADVSYADMAVATLGENYKTVDFRASAPLAEVAEPARFYITLQPAPHNPIYLRSYLLRALASPLVAPHRSMDASGDVWLYYNLAITPAHIVKVPGPFSAAGPHEQDRYSQHWEKLGVASLQIMESFMRACPNNAATASARQAVGEAAFNTWRALPRGFNRNFADRMLRLWQIAPRGPLAHLGAPSFAQLARLLGPMAAAQALRMYRAKPYASVRTLTPEAYDKLFSNLPSTE